MWLLPTTALVAILAAVAPASAYIVFPDRDDPDRLIVLIEKPYGDLVPFGTLPPPFNKVVQTLQGPDRLSFRWRYGRSREEGLSYLHVDEDGKATIHFEFIGGETAGQDTLGAAAVLVDTEGRALHSIYAKSDFSGAAPVNGEERRRVSLSVERPADWWRRVDGIAYFYMRYPKQRNLDEGEQWRAMRRAVWRFTSGAGTEQRQ
ncbi:hypothetical protein [Allomesorhizobium camelthorni]|uniref:Uncharacterized protein n=1 Tax=Allomesorhizobium camelthorni TaxID=475069 RepID=A0A6G4WL27_9HYPH|nr:hypothetical protein [Mesorhizobium camelthorni]NGO55058.1 hypothetical protein [Mesorhizobium camelthorni]